MKIADPFVHDDDWQCDWEAHRKWQWTAGLAATPAQRLAWLEEALEFAWRCGALVRARPDLE